MKALARLLFCGASLAAAAFAQGAPSPIPVQQFFSNNGVPLALGSVCTYSSGTSTPLATFRDYTLGTAWPQCVPLDSAGRASTGIWLNPALLYRFVLKDSTGVTVWTADGVGAGAGGSGGGSSTLWTQNGSTIYNSVLGSKVCIASTACGTALAELSVAAASSGSTHAIRVDDTNNVPGIDLYGSGGSYQGSYLAGTTGLRLQSSDGFAQMTVAPAAVTVQNAAATGGSSLILKQSATQGAVNPLVMQTSTGTNLSWLTPAGALFLAGADGGINVTGASTHVDSIQTVGGVTGTWLYARDSLFLVGEPVPALSGANQARIYFDNTTTPKALYASIDGAAYVPLGSGGGASSLFSAIGTGTNTAATMTVGSGGTLTFSGSGIVNASKLNATTVPVNSAANQLLITTASATGAWATLGDCDDSGGNHLNFDTTTHAFSCGTTGGTVGSVAFSAITGTTATPNTGAQMVIGPGATLDYQGTGTIAANLFNNAVAPPSGSVWKSNGSLQPIATTYPDIVAMFSGGAGCSGTNLLAANGTCQTGTGAGIYLPLAGGTMTGSILFNVSSPGIGIVDVGNASFPVRHGYFSGNVEGVNLRVIQGNPGTILDQFDWRITNTHILDLMPSTGSFTMRVDDLQHQFTFRGALHPQGGSALYDLGFDALNRWRKLWIQDINASGSFTVNGTAPATFSNTTSTTSKVLIYGGVDGGNTSSIYLVNGAGSYSNYITESGSYLGPPVTFGAAVSGTTFTGTTYGGTVFTASTGFASTNNASNVLNIPNGGVLALNGTFGSLSNYLIVQGSVPQINGSSLGAAFNINGASSSNGNIVLNPGAVTGLSSVQVNGRLASASTQSLIINESGGSLGTGISLKHGGTFDAAWQAGTSAAFDVVSNDASTHRLIVLQTGPVLVARTSDNGSGAILQVQGGISFTGSMIPPVGTAVNGTVTCSGGQHIASLTLSQGLVTNYTCN